MRDLEQLVILPKVPSELIRVAIEDIRQTIKDGIEIDMEYWGSGKTSNAPQSCSVCMAGAVMLQRGWSKNIAPDDFDFLGDNEKQYNFLDNIRCGLISTAMNALDIEEHPFSRLLSNNNWTRCLDDFKTWEEIGADAFLLQMEGIAKDFEIIGL